MTNFHSKPNEFCPNLAFVPGFDYLPIKSNSQEGAVVYDGAGEQLFIPNERIVKIVKNPNFSIRALDGVEEFHLTT